MGRLLVELKGLQIAEWDALYIVEVKGFQIAECATYACTHRREAFAELNNGLQRVACATSQSGFRVILVEAMVCLAKHDGFQ